MCENSKPQRGMITDMSDTSETRKSLTENVHTDTQVMDSSAPEPEVLSCAEIKTCSYQSQIPSRVP